MYILFVCVCVWGLGWIAIKPLFAVGHTEPVTHYFTRCCTSGFSPELPTPKSGSLVKWILNFSKWLLVSEGLHRDVCVQLTASANGRPSRPVVTGFRIIQKVHLTVLYILWSSHQEYYRTYTKILQIETAFKVKLCGSPSARLIIVVDLINNAILGFRLFAIAEPTPNPVLIIKASIFVLSAGSSNHRILWPGIMSSRTLS